MLVQFFKGFNLRSTEGHRHGHIVRFIPIPGASHALPVVDNATGDVWEPRSFCKTDINCHLTTNLAQTYKP